MKEHIKTSRDAIVNAMAKSMFDDIEMNMEKLDDLILYGFNGYENYHTDELVKEYQEYICPEDPDSVIVELEGV